jgi:pimeloyl-ACP methyl ester carboxylesterase
MSIKTTNQINLEDGRTLGYAEYGDLQGMPVMHFHGVPSSRLEGNHPLVDQYASQLHIRLIFPDRPGIGISDYKQNRSLLDWSDDVCELADALNLDRFAILGLSGGGPYVAACAYKNPSHLAAAGIISGVGPMNVTGNYEGLGKSDRQAMDMALKSPWLLRALFWYMTRQLRNNPASFIAQLESDLSQADKDQVAQPEIRTTVVEATLEAFRRGGRGAIWDYALAGKPWEFHLEDISIPVFLWHGEEDKICSIQMGRKVAAAIPNCHATYYPGEGHISVYAKYYGEILKTLGDQWNKS